MELSETLQKYRDQYRMYNFEGDRGLERLNQICHDMGYDGHGFRFGSPLECFLSDNPGAIQALLEWVEVNGPDDWQENLEGMLDSDEEAEDE